MKEWVYSLSPQRRLVLAVACFLVAFFLVTNGIGRMMGDPLTEEARRDQQRWAPVAFFLGCPIGFAWLAFGGWLLVVSYQRRERD